MEVITIIKDVIVSIAAVTTVGLAIYGVRSFSRDLKAKAEFKVARHLLRSTYKLRDAISAARAPFISASEFPEGYGGTLTRESDQEKAEAYHHVYRNRWEPIWEAVQGFDADALEAEAIWGSNVKEKTNEYRSCLNTLQTAIEFHVRNLQSGLRELDEEFARKIKEDLYATRDSNDELSESMKNKLANIEQAVIPYLKRS